MVRLEDGAALLTCDHLTPIVIFDIRGRWPASRLCTSEQISGRPRTPATVGWFTPLTGRRNRYDRGLTDLVGELVTRSELSAAVGRRICAAAPLGHQTFPSPGRP
jgi:hypothetical protein